MSTLSSVMVALLVGLSIVAVSATGVGLALFNVNPVPEVPGIHGRFAENRPRAARDGRPEPSRRKSEDRSAAVKPPNVSAKRRFTSAVMLGVLTLTVATVVATVLSIAVVFAVLILT